MLITSARRFRESAYAFCARYVPPDAMAASNKPHAKNTNGMPHESLTPIPQERLTFHPHAQQNAFRRRDARPQSRSFARWNQSLRRSPTSNRLCWRAPTERYNIRRILPDVSMHRYEAKIKWGRNGAKFTDNRYSRAHEWSFDGGVKVSASASPAVVPPRFPLPGHRPGGPGSCGIELPHARFFVSCGETRIRCGKLQGQRFRRDGKK
jgi:hypothetical protein